MTELDREHVLQKIVAVSGFVFALLILPVSQYIITNSRDQAKEQGNVAGVSTDTTITQASITQASATCSQKKEKDLADLQLFLDGKMTALAREYDAQSAAYKAALPLEQDPAGKAALQKLIDEETASYLAKKDQVTLAVDSETKQISSEACATPGPAATTAP